MRRRPLAALLLLALPTSAAAGPAAGRWATPQAHGVVEIRDCGAGVCGYAIDGDPEPNNPEGLDIHNKNPALRHRKVKGMSLFDTMRGGPTKWTGKVYNPIDGGIYSGSITLKSPDVMVLTGCIVWPLCQSQTWRRIPAG